MQSGAAHGPSPRLPRVVSGSNSNPYSCRPASVGGDSIAIDVRLGKVVDELGLPSGDYREIEDFLLEAAHEAGLNGWHLDRLIYGFTEEVLDALTHG